MRIRNEPWKCGQCGEPLDIDGIRAQAAREFGKLVTYIETKCCAAWPVDEDGKEVYASVLIDQLTSIEREARR